MNKEHRRGAIAVAANEQRIEKMNNSNWWWKMNKNKEKE